MPPYMCVGMLVRPVRSLKSTCMRTPVRVQGRELALDHADRLGVLRRLVSYMKEHFGDDARGKRKAWYFLWVRRRDVHLRGQYGAAP